MALPFKQIPMQHPHRRDRDGKPLIQMINEKTVKSGKAAQFGYIPVTVKLSATPPPPSPVSDEITLEVTPVTESKPKVKR